MVENRLNLEPEVQQIFGHIDSCQNFLLSGGAGSGKTYSLVQVIRQVIQENPTSKVACMTYTNAAVKEIGERVSHGNLSVSTIHDFLWDNIKHFQKQLKETLVHLANDEAISRISIEEENPVPINYFDSLSKGIQYMEYLKIKDGIISHDELLIVANYMFANYPKLCDIVKDKFKFIFIDEYQDTNKAVVEVFLNHFQKSKKQNIIGFFGDAMQSIYDDGIGNLNEYKDDSLGLIKEVKKAQNRRSPKKVIDLANKLRTDGITQTSSLDDKAPNMADGIVKEGNIMFIHSENGDISRIEEYLAKNYSWDFSDSKETKELNLTHNLIADKAGFRTLMDIYDGDAILSYRDRIKKYIKGQKINTDFECKTFGEVIDILSNGKTGKELNSVQPTEGMKAFIADNPELYQIAQEIDYNVFSKMYVSNDQLLDDKKQDEADEKKKGSKRDSLIKHLFKIQTNISLYENRLYNEFLKVTDYRIRIRSIEDKKELKKNIESLIDVGNKTIETIIHDANMKGICLIDDKLREFISKNEYIYNRVKVVQFSEFQNLYEYLEGKTPFSTQHKTKGAEFNNVLVILDNGRWNNYNFENLFSRTKEDRVLERTQKIFYVCCTRSKENLAVFYHQPKPEVVIKAKEWFGDENVIEL